MTRYELDEQVKDFTEATDGEEAGAAARPFSIWPWPWSLEVSGLYEYRRRGPVPRPRPLPVHPVSASEADLEDEIGAALFLREEIRLDVDGRYPQMQVSGTRYNLLSPLIHWIARLRPAGNNTWSGRIWYKDGNVGSFPYTAVKVAAQASFFPNQRKVTISYGGGGGASFTRTYAFRSSSFHAVEFEYDRVEHATAVTAIDTCDHPNRPPSLPCETLSFETAFRRAGFAVKKSGDDDKLPLSLAGGDARWSDMEMHDAMQTYWSRFANKAQWSLWVLFAALHERGTGLGGVMFDDIGPNHRQGTAIFSDSFISHPPPNDPDPAAWVKRMRFWTACHEMGHAFNLAHSWQKSLGAPYGSPWIPLADEPEARSFMNYPDNVSGRQAAFFADFEYRFSDGELLFMRHAPSRFVQMGNADWFDHHGFEQAAAATSAALQLTARVERNQPVFAYLEPPAIKLELTNASQRPQIVPGDVLDHTDGMMVIIKKRGGRARQWLPYARYCTEAEPKVLMPGQSISGSVFAAVGRNGWDLAEPGVYIVQVAIEHDEELIVSNPLTIKVRPPERREEELVAQDVCTDEVGRVLTFQGTRVLKTANDALREAIARLGEHPLCHHANLALGRPLMRDYKVLSLRDGAPSEVMRPAIDLGGQVRVARADEEEARRHLQAALDDGREIAAATFGHAGYARQVASFAAWLDEKGDRTAAETTRGEVAKLLHARHADETLIGEVTARA